MKPFFRGPGDVIAVSVVVVSMVTMFGALCYVKGKTDERIAWERTCGDRMTCEAKAKGYEIVKTGGVK